MRRVSSVDAACEEVLIFGRLVNRHLAVTPVTRTSQKKNESVVQMRLAGVVLLFYLFVSVFGDCVEMEVVGGGTKGGGTDGSMYLAYPVG